MSSELWGVFSLGLFFFGLIYGFVAGLRWPR